MREERALGYIVRFRDSRNRLVELNASNGLPQSIHESVGIAGVLADRRLTTVVVLEHGSLACVVRPDPPAPQHVTKHAPVLV